MTPDEVRDAQERVFDLVRLFFDEPDDFWESVDEVGVVGLAVEIRYKNDSTGISYQCSDERYWVTEGLFRAAANVVTESEATD